MIRRRMEDKLEELKSYFNTKFNEQEESLTKTFNNIIVDLKKRSLKKYNMKFRNNVNSSIPKTKC